MLKWTLGSCSANTPAATMPAVNSSESPGRKNPISRPDSAKTIAKMRSRPPLEISFSGSMNSKAARIVVNTASTLPLDPRPARGPSGAVDARG